MFQRFDFYDAVFELLYVCGDGPDVARRLPHHGRAQTKTRLIAIINLIFPTAHLYSRRTMD